MMFFSQLVQIIAVIVCFGIVILVVYSLGREKNE